MKSEQERNLALLGRLAIVPVVAALAIAILLYVGVELPPYGMREYLTSATGYAAPPRSRAAVAGTVPRSGSVRIASGESLYRVNCAMCHGEPDRNVGPVAERYLPRPPDLTGYVRKHPAERLYRAITEGIRSTPTPEARRYLPDDWHAFRSLMSERERRAVVAYLRQRVEGSDGGSG
jgi:mono/diheme cytochrome c family protein